MYIEMYTSSSVACHYTHQLSLHFDHLTGINLSPPGQTISEIQIKQEGLIGP